MPYLREDEAPTQSEREKMPEHLFGLPEEKKYPLDTEAHVRAAASYSAVEHNAGRLSAEKFGEIGKRIEAAKKRLGMATAKDDSGWERIERRDATGATKEFRKNAQGFGLVTRANLTRTGVFAYRQPDGSTRRELRSPEEVFHPDSLASLAGATVTDDHPGVVNGDNWREESIGHVLGKPERDGDFAAADLQVDHGDAVEKATKGKLREVSCGYSVAYDPTPGTWNGQRYDGVHRNIRYNHVALGPEGWGRQGPDVRMRMDGGAHVGVLVDGSDDPGRYVRGMGDENTELATAKQVAKDANEAADKARQDAKDAKTEQERADAKSRELVAENTRLRADNDLLKLQQKQVDGESDAKRRADAKTREDRMLEETIQVRADAAEVLGKDFKPQGKSVEQIKRDCIKVMSPDFKLDTSRLDAMLADAKSDAERDLCKESIRLVVDSAYGTAKSHWDAVQKANRDLEVATRGDRKTGSDEDPDQACDAEASRKKMDKEMREASGKKPPRRDRRRGAVSATSSGEGK